MLDNDTLRPTGQQAQRRFRLPNHPDLAGRARSRRNLLAGALILPHNETTGVRKIMPIFAYFLTTGSVLLGLLLALSAYLDLTKAPSPTELLGIGPAKAQVVAAEKESHFLRLKQIPINAMH